MRVDELMTKTVISCGPDQTLEQASQLLWEHDCGALPVVGEHNQLHGMITDRDVCMAAYTTGERLANLLVREAMAIDVVSLRGDQPIQDAARAMREHRVRRIPVIDDEHCVIGVLSCNDLIRRATDTASTGRDPLEALHLLQTMAIIGRSRLAPHMKALPPHSDDRPRTPPLFAPSNDSMRRSIAVAVAARGK